MFNKLRYWLYRLRFNHPELFKHKPIHLDLELVRACNLLCPFCYRQEEGFVHRFPRKLMDVIAAVEHLKKYYKQGYRSVKFNWRGEPLLHTRLGTIAGIAKDMGYLDTMINTNLAALDDRSDFINSLDNFTDIRVSLDTMHEALYAEMRPPAKLKTVIHNLVTLIKKYDPKKTKLIIQRRTDGKTEDNKRFIDELWDAIYKLADHATIKKFDRNVVIISKPIQPRIAVKVSYNGDKPINTETDTSYFAMWANDQIDRQYCKQPSQRTVVGVDGKEWACCLAYKEPHALSAENREMLIECLNKRQNNIWPAECFQCTSYQAYKEKR
jgi:molybdenum cofactor biosynthesis enzyme MoaA